MILLLMLATTFAMASDVKYPLSKDKISVVMQAIEQSRTGKEDVCLGDCGSPELRKQIVQNAAWGIVDKSNVKSKRRSGITTYFDKKTKRSIEHVDVKLDFVNEGKMIFTIYLESYMAPLGGLRNKTYTFTRMKGKWVLKKESTVVN